MFSISLSAHTQADVSHQLFLEAELAKALEAQRLKEIQYEQQLTKYVIINSILILF
jgi:hypothetical protein